MLYTDTDSFFLHLTVDNLAKEINARLQLRNAFDFSEIEHIYISQLLVQKTNFTVAKSVTSKMKQMAIQSSSLLHYALRCKHLQCAAPPNTLRELTSMLKNATNTLQIASRILKSGGSNTKTISTCTTGSLEKCSQLSHWL